MKATVTFKIGEIEIKIKTKAPDSSIISEAGKKRMAIFSALTKFEKETDFNLRTIAEDISDKATVVFEYATVEKQNKEQILQKIEELQSGNIRSVWRNDNKQGKTLVV